VRSPTARRPAGWSAPGPPPAPSADPRVLGPRAGEHLSYLAGDWRILQRADGHRWSLDDLVTAWFAARDAAGSPPRTLLDLGSGIGAVLMLLAWRLPALSAVGIEAQPMSVDLARRSLAWNGVDGRARVIEGDIREATVLAAGSRFDLVTGTPPYLRPGAATVSTRVQRGPCHVAYRGGIEDYCAAAARWMTADGRFVVCEAAGLARVECAAVDAGLAIARRMDVIPRAGKPALFSVYALRRAAGRPATAIDGPLVVRDAAGEWTVAFRAVRRDMGMPPVPPDRPG
jgi:tRNA1Val (adenine37-N6)-methyltransferase